MLSDAVLENNYTIPIIRFASARLQHPETIYLQYLMTTQYRIYKSQHILYFREKALLTMYMYFNKS